MFSWENFDYFHVEDLPKHPDPKILEALAKESEKENEEDEP